MRLCEAGNSPFLLRKLFIRQHDASSNSCSSKSGLHRPRVDVRGVGSLRELARHGHGALWPALRKQARVPAVGPLLRLLEDGCSLDEARGDRAGRVVDAL
eukprot:645240-Rhodomonas_salina.1